MSLYYRGARRSPIHRIAGAMPHRPRQSIPDWFGVIPGTLSALGNNQYGDCVSAEEFASKEAYSLYGSGTTELVFSDQSCIQWARQHGVLNGADLVSVLDWARTDGLQATDGKSYHTGTHQSVDWTKYDVLSSAIATGPVKIAVAANQLEQAVNSTNGQSGWICSGFYRDQNTDHCVGLWGYGTVDQLVKLFASHNITVNVPSNQSVAEQATVLYTWGMVGICTMSSLIAFCDEAWVRTPTTVEAPQPVPGPTPEPPPAPTPGPTPGPTPQPTPQPTPIGLTTTVVVPQGPFHQSRTLIFTGGSLTGEQ